MTQAMQFNRTVAIVARASKTLDVRKARRASSVALRWTDRNRAAGWDLGEYHAMRRRACRKSRYYTSRYLRNVRARQG